MVQSIGMVKTTRMKLGRDNNSWKRKLATILHYIFVPFPNSAFFPFLTPFQFLVAPALRPTTTSYCHSPSDPLFLSSSNCSHSSSSPPTHAPLHLPRTSRQKKSRSNWSGLVFWILLTFYLVT